ncbi:hypothetical protein [Flavobacterium sp.]|uniref:hypothetical protein n=1 Tax=Flavobacterium sp. TaxID=239 RepID=UPI001B640143|nr:hypothetical protein [Flavobacterium sp.]MBP6183142.1 hypothetical protein [Flavobacterium sp.]
MNTKKIFIIFCIIASQLINSVNAQAPQSFNYQAVAHTSSGAIISSQAVSFRISILQGSATGSSVYSEIHAVTTNQSGLVNFAIGGGTLVSGNFATINWSQGPYFVKVELDATGGSTYVTMSTTQLLSVPYAQYAERSGNLNVFSYTKLNGRNDMVLPQGGTQKSTYSLNYICGNLETISFSNSTLPSGVTISHSSASNVIDFVDTLIVNATSSALAGTYPITLTATSSSGSKAIQTININIFASTFNFQGNYSHHDSLYLHPTSTPFAYNGPFNSTVSAVVSNQFTITNFGQNGVTITATVNNRSYNQVSFTIPNQTVSGCTYSGSGDFFLSGRASIGYYKTCGGTKYSGEWKP